MVQPRTPSHERGQSFQHTPLDLKKKSIRLLEIHARPHPWAPIQCSIRQATIDEEYVCLSYVWGPAQPSHCIYVNGRSFQVRENLYEFLKIASSRRARRHNLHSPIHVSHGVERPLFKKITCAMWVDALCIDQENPDERNHQVRLFGDIYSRASVVIAWLGSSGDLRQLFRTWRHSLNVKVALHRSSAIFGTCVPISITSQKSSHLERYRGQAEKWNQLRFTNNTYWTRAWTTQEVLNAGDLVFIASDRAIRLEEIIYGEIHTYGQATYQDDNVWAHLVDSKAFHESFAWLRIPELHRSVPRPDLSSLQRLWGYRTKECTEARDKVFSLLSVSSNGNEIDVDYDIPIERIALQFLHVNQDEFCVCHAVMVFDTLKASLLLLADSTGPDNYRNFVDVQLRMQETGEDTSHVDMLRLDLTCHHINFKPSRRDIRSWHTRTFRGGTLQLQKESFEGLTRLVHPVYWVDPLTQESYVFSDNEQIYFARQDEDACTLRFSLGAFARLINQLGNVDKRVEFVGAIGRRIILPKSERLSNSVVLAAPPRVRKNADIIESDESKYDWPKPGTRYLLDTKGTAIPVHIAEVNPKWTLLPQLDRPRPIQNSTLPRAIRIKY